jgi:hypothetical protein
LAGLRLCDLLVVQCFYVYVTPLRGITGSQLRLVELIYVLERSDVRKTDVVESWSRFCGAGRRLGYRASGCATKA